MNWIMTNWIEALGYLGSFIVLVSLVMSNMLWLRWINLIGAGLFSIYGLLIFAVPVFTLNGLIVVIDIYYLVGIYRARELFSLMEINSDDPTLNKFFSFYETDIQRFFSGFDREKRDAAIYMMVFRDVTPVGVFAYEKTTQNTARVLLDYISPNYRDYKNAEFLLRTRKDQFIKQGITTLESVSQIKAHQKYLRKIGFTSSPDSPDTFTKSLA